MKKDLLGLKKLYVESQEDVQILRERMRKQSSSSSIGEEGSSKSDVDGREDLILQLEEYKDQVEYKTGFKFFIDLSLSKSFQIYQVY